MKTPLQLSRSPLASPGLDVNHKLIRNIPFSAPLEKAAVRRRMHRIMKERFMRIYRKRKAIFIRVPKNASTSLCRFLFPELPHSCWPGHLSAEFFQTLDRPLYEASHVFAPIRNPEQRLRSAFNYYRHSSPVEAERKLMTRTIGETGNFETFLEYLSTCDRLEEVEIMRWHHFRPQADFITSKEGLVIADMLFPVEDMAPAVHVISNWFGITEEVPRENPSSGPQHSVELPGNIQKHYKDDQILWEKVIEEKTMFV